MFILQNAFQNILRNRGRNLLIGAITFVIIISSVVALMINNTAKGIIDDYKERFSAEVGLVPDMEKLREQAMENSTEGRVRVARPTIPAEQYISFGDSEYLQSSVYTASVAVNSEETTAVDAELGGSANRQRMGMTEGTEPTQFMMKLLANQFDDFTEGLREIAEGRLPENEDEGMISSDFAELNSLALGDTLTLTSELRDENLEIHDIDYELTIVGIYFDATDEYSEGASQNAFTNRRNEILASYETIVAPIDPELSGIQISATYYLKNPDMLEAFAEELYAKGLDPIFDVTTDKASYDRIIGPVEGLKGISITFMIIVLVFGGTIIALLASIAIRERKYEIGVLRAMGLKKHKVAFGLWSEMLMITSLCLVVGIGAGTLVAQPVTNILLDHQIETAEATSDQMFAPRGMMGRGGMSNPMGSSDAQPLESIDISLGLDTTFQMIGIALLLASFAGFVSTRKITKYEPIKILMERN